MQPEEDRSGGAAWEERIQWILDEYEGGSRRAMGRKVGLSGQAISAWARGETRPSGEGLAAIIRTYPQVRARWLLTGRGSPRIAPGPSPASGDGRERGEGASSDGEASANGSAAAVERAYEAGRRDALMEMMQMLTEIGAFPEAS